MRREAPRYTGIEVKNHQPWSHLKIGALNSYLGQKQTIVTVSLEDSEYLRCTVILQYYMYKYKYKYSAREIIVSSEIFQVLIVCSVINLLIRAFFKMISILFSGSVLKGRTYGL